MVRSFEIDDAVMAKWPGDSSYYTGIVKDFNDIEYLVEFNDDDKSRFAIKYKYVKAPFKAKSKRSTSRGRSPGRSPSRRKSPGRKSPGRTPGRKSPGRPTKRKSPIAANNVNANVETESQEVLLQEDTVLRHRTKSATPPARQSPNISEEKTQESMEAPKVNDVSKTEKPAPTEPVAEPVKTCISIKGIFSCLLKGLVGLFRWVFPTMKLLPAILFFIGAPLVFNQACTKNKCSITQMPDIPKDMKHYFDVKAVAILAAFVLLQILMAAVPIGKVVQPENGSTIRMNGYITLIVNLVSVPALLHLQYNVLVVYQLYRQLLASCTALSIVLSLIFFVKSKFSEKKSLNPNGTTGHFVPDMFEGREVCPKIGSVDVKFVCFRFVCMTMILLNMIIIIKDIQSKNGEYNLTLILSAALQMLYGLDLVWFEEAYLTTYEYKYQGTGLLFFTGYLTSAFYTLVITRYTMNHASPLAWYFLLPIVALNLLGYVIMRSSNSQKHAFRVNPNDPAVAHLESFPTAVGSRLLVSGWWGFVRHPNYLGDMIIMVSWGLLCGFKHALPWVLIGITVSYLVMRTFLVESQCKTKYRLAWNNYTSRVKYRIIPYVF